MLTLARCLFSKTSSLVCPQASLLRSAPNDSSRKQPDNPYTGGNSRTSLQRYRDRRASHTHGILLYAPSPFLAPWSSQNCPQSRTRSSTRCRALTPYQASSSGLSLTVHISTSLLLRLPYHLYSIIHGQVITDTRKNAQRDVS